MEMARRSYTQADLRTVISELAPGWGDRISLSPEVRQRHGGGRSGHGERIPDLVVYPFSNEEVAQVVRLCARYRIPIMPFGSGHARAGQLQAMPGGVCLDLSEMNRIIEINGTDRDCRVQAGVTVEQLNLDLSSENLFFPHDAAPNATIGGIVASGASAIRSERFGTLRSAVSGLTLVTAAGEIVRTGGRSRKSPAGYDLTPIFVGAEGTLGVITEVQLSVKLRPQQIRTAVCSFTSLQDAVHAVIAAERRNINLSRVELLNQLQMAACIRHTGLQGFGEAVTLFIEFQGCQVEMTEQVLRFTDILAEFNGSNFKWAAGEQQRDKLWEARHEAWQAALELKPGAAILATDVCVPLSSLGEVLAFAEDQAEKAGLSCPIVGHVADGHFHMLTLLDPLDSQQQKSARQLSEAMVHKVLGLEGSCSSEAGIGEGKKHFLSQEQAGALEMMRLVKHSLDPGNLMNPGKVLDL